MNEKLTAYALNELPPDERAALETQMKHDPALREQAEQVRAFCELLGREVSTGKDDVLMPAQRARLMQEFQNTAKIIRPFWRNPAYLGGLGLAAAACIAVMLSIHGMKQSPVPATQEEASLAVNVKPAAPETPRAGLSLAKKQEAAGFGVVADTETPKKPAVGQRLEDRTKKVMESKAAEGLILAGAAPVPSRHPALDGGQWMPPVIPPPPALALQLQPGITSFGRLNLGDTSDSLSSDLGRLASNTASQPQALNEIRHSAGTNGSLPVTRFVQPSDVALQASPLPPLPGIANDPATTPLLAAREELAARRFEEVMPVTAKDSPTLEFRSLGRVSGVGGKGLNTPGGTVWNETSSGKPAPIGLSASTSLDKEAAELLAEHGRVAQPSSSAGALMDTAEKLNLGSSPMKNPVGVAAQTDLRAFITAGGTAAAPKESLAITGALRGVAAGNPGGGDAPLAPVAAQPKPSEPQIVAGALVTAAPLAQPMQVGGSEAAPAPPSVNFAISMGTTEKHKLDVAAPAAAAEAKKNLELFLARDPGEARTYTNQRLTLSESESESVKSLSDLDADGTKHYYRLTRERGTATYRPIIENPFSFVAQQPLSTFSLDVDTASYANVRRFLNSGQRPPPDAVRLEELINYFPYHYEAPAADKPLAVQAAVADAPWQPLHRLARIAVKARDVKGERAAANFVFLIDVSGSMEPPERLPLIKQSLRLLVDQLREDDRVAIVTYAGESGVALESTVGTQKEKINSAIEKLKAGGSTNGASGIRLAYEQAAVNFEKNRINRVILCTDGDFNVGTSSVQELEKLIAEKAKSGVFLTALGVGTDNLHDHTMQALADRGNGNYHYLDSVAEARKVLVDQMTGTLVTVAKDVKVQVEFNPAQVAAYRLIGYEKRLLAKEDFNNDKKDAGEIGAGHSVTALYEIVPASLKYPDGKPVVDELKYTPKLADNAPRLAPDAPTAPAAPAPFAQPEPAAATPAPMVKAKARASSDELMTIKVRYKEPGEDKSRLFEVPVTDSHRKLSESDKEFQFAVSVAGFGMLLRGSPNAGDLTWENIRKLALSGKGADEQGWRGEFIQLIEKARGLSEEHP